MATEAHCAIQRPFFFFLREKSIFYIYCKWPLDIMFSVLFLTENDSQT